MVALRPFSWLAGYVGNAGGDVIHEPLRLHFHANIEPFRAEALVRDP